VTLRVIHDPPQSGPVNMAADEVLLHRVGPGESPPTLRFYQWDPPAISLGYFQKYAEYEALPPPAGDLPVVRRLTGGGAIIHDVELTYSLVVPGGHSLARHRNLLYETVHNSLIAALAEFDVAARLHQSQDPTPRGEEPFLCFRRRAGGDVVAGPTKIAGSAQRRRRGAVLQHGSVLLARSAAAPELQSLLDLASAPLDKDRLIAGWCETLRCRLALLFEPKPLAEHQRHRAAELVRSKYATDHWTRNRGR